LVLVVMGVLAADNNLALTFGLLGAGAAMLCLFFVHVRSDEKKGREPLLRIALFRNRESNIGMVTQNVQWLLLMGTAFTVSAYLQVVRGYNAIQTGVIFTAATGGILVSSLAAERLARRHSQRTLITAGFVATAVGIVVLVALVKGRPGAWAFAPGLLFIGLGVGTMLTPSVNVVQSAFPDEEQGEISGLSRCVSNLGSSLGTAIAGTILVAGLDKHAYGAAMLVLAFLAIVGLGVTRLLPVKTHAAT
jgi:MFS family permease